MKRVVVTGMGIVSCLGNDKDSVISSLREGRSGIRFKEEYKEMGLRSNVAGQVDIDISEHIDRKPLRFMGDAAAYAYISMAQAIADSGLNDDQVSNIRTGIVAGSGGGSSSNQVQAADILREKGVKRIGPYMVPRVMTSTVSACLATPFKIRGVNYSITSACATSAHCIGHAMELIQLGKQDVVFAGGGEEEHWALTMMFDAMGALSTKFNDTPDKASRAFDASRDGFVIAGGGGMLVLEEYEHAKARGAKIYAELVGYGATSDGSDMVAPSGEGAMRCMQMAMSTVDTPVDYINAHGTSTPVGDAAEIGAVREVFGTQMPVVGSTKSLTGHSLGAAGVQEAIYSLLMLENDFIAESINIEQLDEKIEGANIAREYKENAGLKTVMSNSFGFGGTNATLVFRKMD
ncbi:MAG: beta-ketoacyl-[acyl-carrier-protein] synthase I [Pseudomonadales bacterium]|uniref:beta-ketoacyl-ACP synthase I n=1 Tax=unclassified Ketobacter TaxID=2639109 RepID=UPI000C69D753|nr:MULTISPECIES: beta-ketoacyl-ACP synthase I [unclassified Ketobacter]MAA60674.1 beta-ketoacyl-[acyl-carrier-protein] synthase I [Pseudomonadales bacterium]MEC8814117.1 beta-ketoacyl-ACP synthase I [Pseudomonadota bacterium]HAG93005.1 beta-ketoacyl-ACP synthase I [Gammaproteobacteria bacterium]MAQ25064.1 beta-ketoacyl-[acyl-carrier-protein] synthase I [Pseudomonadales bacterium]MBI26914.1 beta-ketoacyl-[acyl-carrier-protein] synthase I [Pseudomonadales bacterium]|tara:strand:+ start:1646 stop:2860 length:1215 start_codon:yes stop_codon:yes gene_type:complete